LEDGRNNLDKTRAGYHHCKEACHRICDRCCQISMGFSDFLDWFAKVNCWPCWVADETVWTNNICYCVEDSFLGLLLVNEFKIIYSLGFVTNFVNHNAVCGKKSLLIVVLT